jgi:hypothetical protein
MGTLDARAADTKQEATTGVVDWGAHTQRDGAGPPQGMLLEPKLPPLDGVELLKEMWADPRTVHSPTKGWGAQI